MRHFSSRIPFNLSKWWPSEKSVHMRLNDVATATTTLHPMDGAISNSAWLNTPSRIIEWLKNIHPIPITKISSLWMLTLGLWIWRSGCKSFYFCSMHRAGSALGHGFFSPMGSESLVCWVYGGLGAKAQSTARSSLLVYWWNSVLNSTLEML
jgi:hypothetical protein